jgi:hypothetical protein
LDGNRGEKTTTTTSSFLSFPPPWNWIFKKQKMEATKWRKELKEKKTLKMLSQWKRICIPGKNGFTNLNLPAKPFVGCLKKSSQCFFAGGWGRREYLFVCNKRNINE